MTKRVAILAALLAPAVLLSCATTGKAAKADSKKTTSSAASPAKEGAPATSSADLFDGFENEDGGWKAGGSSWNDGDLSSYVEISSDWATEGKSSLKCAFNYASSKDAHATFMTEIPAYPDMSAYKSVSFDVYNPLDLPVQVSFSLSTGDTWYWYETNEYDIAAGEKKTVTVDLTSQDWKCANTNWQFTSKLVDRDDVRRVTVKFMLSQGAEGGVYIDNMRLN